jgi:hypothetical protein
VKPRLWLNGRSRALYLYTYTFQSIRETYILWGLSGDTMNNTHYNLVTTYFVVLRYIIIYLYLDMVHIYSPTMTHLFKSLHDVINDPYICKGTVVSLWTSGLQWTACSWASNYPVTICNEKVLNSLLWTKPIISSSRCRTVAVVSRNPKVVSLT